MRHVSNKDIARDGKVSHPTVARALRHRQLVRSETAKEIRKIAETMGYRPSAIGRSLATRKTNMIGVVVTTIADPFIADVVRGIEDTANEFGYSVFLANSNANPDREIQVVHSFHERRVDGILVAASRVGALYVPLLSRLSVPIVLLYNQSPDAPAPFVRSVTTSNSTASSRRMW